jgi:hypothetical protein
MSLEPARYFQDACALQTQWDNFHVAGARCSFDRGRLALTIVARAAGQHEYTLCCVHCGRHTPPFVVVEGIAVVL